MILGPRTIPRTLESRVRALASRWPVVTVTGPRQSGKTTLVRKVFPEYRYTSLEAHDVREYAASDPRGFLAEHGAGAILDEIQRVPELLSYLQAEIDERPEPGRYVVTGSAHLGLLGSVSQSLAGRTAVTHLLPCSLSELRRFEIHADDLLTTLWSGAYPAIFDRKIPPGEWFRNYLTTYLERDVRQVTQVGDLAAFQTFLRLCAGRVGQVLNLSQLGADCGISHNTARAWLSVLETGFVAFRLQPYSTNLRKRETKSPKVYFFDSGLVCALLGIRTVEELRHHPSRGAIFEGWVVAEVVKNRLHRGLRPEVAFYRNGKGLEIDLLVRRGGALAAVEIKSGATVVTDMLAGLRKFAAMLREAGPVEPECMLVYGGDQEQRRSDIRVLPWARVDDQVWG